LNASITALNKHCCCSELRELISFAFMDDSKELLCIEDAGELLLRFAACGDDKAVAKLLEISGVDINMQTTKGTMH
jgi:hypothetical protein